MFYFDILSMQHMFNLNSLSMLDIVWYRLYHIEYHVGLLQTAC